MNRTAAWVLGTEPDEPPARHPGPRTLRVPGNPRGQSRERTGCSCCQMPWSPWSWVQPKRQRKQWKWTRLHQIRPGTAPARLRCLPSDSTNSGAGVPARLPTRRAGSTPSISLGPPNSTDIPQGHLQDVLAINTSCQFSEVVRVLHSHPPALAREVASPAQSLEEEHERGPSFLGAAALG